MSLPGGSATSNARLRSQYATACWSTSSSVHPGRHYGHAGTWKVNFAPGNARSLFTFDLPTLPLQCTVSQAVLKLKGTYSGTPKSPDAYPSANMNVSMAKGRWTEAGVTWRNMPGGDACDGGGQDYARTNQWVLTGVVQSPEKKDEVIRIAQSTDGVQRVEDHLTVGTS